MANPKPLEDFVYGSREGYSWRYLHTDERDGYSVHFLNLTSQHWPSEDSPWHHWLIVVEPKRLESHVALLYIGSGQTDEDMPNGPDDRRISLVDIALATGVVTAEIRCVPNQPISFQDEHDERYKSLGRREDALVAYTWDRFLKGGDATLLATMPMTRAVVRALDALTESSKTVLNANVVLEEFVLMGASKRGWTAWMTAAIDQRVVAVVPLVIDLLNLKESMRHHYEAYGCWSPALQDYIDMRIPERWHTKEFAELLELVDPYAFRKRVTMPKYLVNASGDQFFLPDSSRLYFESLVGDKWLRYLPNADHALQGHNLNGSFSAFIKRLLQRKALPKLSWKLAFDGTLEVYSDERPSAVNLWQASNAYGRDFRMEIGPEWESSPLKPAVTSRVTCEPPQEGWKAYFVEFTFEDGFVCTTDVFVVPDIVPFSFATRERS